jgi:formylglycine-generating enzyme required for sulfatase activity
LGWEKQVLSGTRSRAVAFDEWEACVADGGCDGYKPSDNCFGGDRRPVINVSWDNAQKYVS